jgi:hypothetical protein
VEHWHPFKDGGKVSVSVILKENVIRTFVNERKILGSTMQLPFKEQQLHQP